QVTDVARMFPKMRIWVIEPSNLEISKDADGGMQKVEFDYSKSTLAMRRQIGFNAAAAAQAAFNDPANSAPGVYIISTESVRSISPYAHAATIDRDATQGMRPGRSHLIDARS